MILKKFFDFLVLILFFDFENVEPFSVQNDNKIEKQQTQVEDLSVDGRPVSLRINLINSLIQEMKPEIYELMAALTEKISKDCCHKNEIVEVLSELSTLKEQMKSLLNDQNRNQAAFEEQLKRIEVAIKSVTTTTTTTAPTTTTPAPISIKKAKFDESFNCIQNCGDPKDLPNDCSEVKNENENENGNGIFLLKPPQGSELKPFGAVCSKDENKNWTIIQRHFRNRTISFDRNWEEYKNGFGVLHADYWLGLDRIYQLTANKKYELWMKWRNENYVTVLSSHYSEFSVADEGNGYKLKFDGFSGDLDYLKDFNESKFSTYDKDNDGNEPRNCAREDGGGWWYEDGCIYGGLNCKMYRGYYTQMAIHPA